MNQLNKMAEDINTKPDPHFKKLKKTLNNNMAICIEVTPMKQSHS